MKQLYAILNILRFSPALLACLFSASGRVVKEDLKVYARQDARAGSTWFLLLWFLTYHRSFRALFYFRLGWVGRIVSVLGRPIAPFKIAPDCRVGEGLLLIHSYGTVLNSPEIGSHCTIYHLVTLGERNDYRPRIGNNVTIYPNAVITGDVEIGDNCVIGPGAIVHKSVPANCTVAGASGIIIRRNGVKVHESL